MWAKFWFFDAPVWMWQMPDDMVIAYKMATPPPTHAWAQASDDAPWRMWKRA
jgi:hypothetical protein